MAHANPIQIQKYLKGVDYPANKATLIENARKLGADESVCASLEQLPDEDFQTPAEVSQAFKGPSEDNVEQSQGEAAGGKAAAPRDEGTKEKAAEHKPRHAAPGSNEFLVQVMQDSLAEIELCMLALRKSATPKIGKFALAMIDEHSMLGQEMEQLAQKKKLHAKIQLSDEHMAAIDKMSKLSARDFDQRFMEQNLKDHENDLKVFKHYAAEEKDGDIKALAEKGEKMYTKHLKMVKDFDKKKHG